MTARTKLGRCTFLALLMVVFGVAMVFPVKAMSNEALNDALFNACERGNLEEVRRLLAQGADVNAKGLFSATPLMRASSQGHAQVVEDLISRGSEVNARSLRGVTALMDAARWSNDARGPGGTP